MTLYIIEQSGQFFWELHAGLRVTIKSEFSFPSGEHAIIDSESWCQAWIKGVGVIEKTRFIKREEPKT